MVHVQDRGVAGIGHIWHDLVDAIDVAAVWLLVAHINTTPHATRETNELV